jgi:ABC-type multidrug transport system fused ATPase/permease subunit
VTGETGSGKTTLVDLLAGLLEPSTGRILADGEPLSEDGLPAWRARLGYVAQTPMILDDTMAANITVGREPDGASSDEAIAAAVAGAQLDRTLENLPEGLATRVGERGARLSGGQRQRLAIARALFRGADVLILDESTSALDEETERAVLETLGGLRGRMTVIMISHRPASRFAPDLVVRVEHGTARVEPARPARASAAARS